MQCNYALLHIHITLLYLSTWLPTLVEGCCASRGEVKARTDRVIHYDFIISHIFQLSCVLNLSTISLNMLSSEIVVNPHGFFAAPGCLNLSPASGSYQRLSVSSGILGQHGSRK